MSWFFHVIGFIEYWSSNVSLRSLTLDHFSGWPLDLACIGYKQYYWPFSIPPIGYVITTRLSNVITNDYYWSYPDIQTLNETHASINDLTWADRLVKNNLNTPMLPSLSPKSFHGSLLQILNGNTIHTAPAFFLASASVYEAFDDLTEKKEDWKTGVFLFRDFGDDEELCWFHGFIYGNLGTGYIIPLTRISKLGDFTTISCLVHDL